MTFRVVIDTNCVVSALLFSRQTMSWLRLAWQEGRLMPLVSRDTTLELLRVLAYPKFKLTPDEQSAILADFLPYTESVDVTHAPDDVPVVRDAADQKFLNLALSAHAAVLVTGDQDLLVLKPIVALPILTVREFEIWLRNAR